MRLVGTSLECYKYLEPLYNDYRKMRRKDKLGGMYVRILFTFINSTGNMKYCCHYCALLLK